MYSLPVVQEIIHCLGSDEQREQDSWRAETAKYPTSVLSVWYRSHVLQKSGLQPALLNFDCLHEVNSSTAYITRGVF